MISIGPAGLSRFALFLRASRAMEATSINLCSQPPWVIASRHFNRHPKPLDIQGVRHANRLLFERLDACEDPRQRGELFHDYMDVTFQLHQWERETSQRGRKSLRNSYIRFLRGWLFDSNSVEGAVLKGWVESRFGLRPTFHKQEIFDLHGEEYVRYNADRMRGTARTNAINAQFDVLYEYVQYELLRRQPERDYFTLYRGINDFSENRILERFDRRRCLVRLNNLTSFTSEFERAWEFGTRVLKADVPRPKIFFRGSLLPSRLLHGEEEVLVIGGEYEVEVLIGG